MNQNLCNYTKHPTHIRSFQMLPLSSFTNLSLSWKFLSFFAEVARTSILSPNFCRYFLSASTSCSTVLLCPVSHLSHCVRTAKVSLGLILDKTRQISRQLFRESGYRMKILSAVWKQLRALGSKMLKCSLIPGASKMWTLPLSETATYEHSAVTSPRPTSRLVPQAKLIRELLPDEMLPIRTWYLCPETLLIGSVNLILVTLFRKVLKASSLNYSYLAGSCNYLAFSKAAS